MKNETTVERRSDREMVITRTFNGPPRIVFEAWTKPELFTRWWLPRSIGCQLVSFDADIRTGGSYRLVSKFAGGEPMAFFGKYVEVTPHARLVWTNEESADAGQVTTVTFEEKAGKTLVVVHELYPSKEALDANEGASGAMAESFDQLDELLAS